MDDLTPKFMQQEFTKPEMSPEQLTAANFLLAPWEKDLLDAS